MDESNPHSTGEDSLSEEETARRRDEIVKRMLATPPQPRAVPKPREKAKKRAD